MTLSTCRSTLPRPRRGLALSALALAALLGSQAPTAAAALPAGTPLVIDPNAGTGFAGALFTVDPASGNRTLLSDFGNIAQGLLGLDPFGVALAANGDILVIDPSAGTGSRGALFTVDPASGNRTLLSDFSAGAQGPLGESPFGVAVVPPDADGDNDGLSDSMDNCIQKSNPGQRDSNGDGFGNVCDPDLNNDGVVNNADFVLMRSVFYSSNADADLNGDGVANFADLAILKSLLNQAPGPSGTAP